jgi:hypothetical protein
MGSSKPYLQAACFCERVIIDNGDQAASVIRILGRVDVQLPKNWPEGMLPPEIQANLFACFAAGDYEGTGTISITAVSPDGKRFPVANRGATLLRDQITYVSAVVKLGGPAQGTHWFEIYWGENLEAKVPLFINISKTLPEVPHFGKPPETKSP